MVELTQEQKDAILAPVVAVIEAKVAEAQVTPAVYSEEQYQAGMLAAKAEEKARLKALMTR